MLDNRNFLCKIEESIDHILLHCLKARVLWQLHLVVWCFLGLVHHSERDY